MLRRASAAFAALMFFALVVAVAPAIVVTAQEPAAEPPEATTTPAAGETTPADGEPTAATGLVEVAATPSVADLANAIDQPRVGPPVDMGDAIAVGRGTFRPRAGTSVRLLLAGGKPAGVLISGPGSFDYRVEDRFSIPIVRRNLGEGASLATRDQDGALVLSTPFDTAAVWSWGLGAEAARRAGDGGGEAGASLTPRLRNLLSDALFASPSVYLLHSRGVAGDDGRAYALAVGGTEDLLLTVDPAISRSESLDVVTGVSRYNTVQRGLSTLFAIATQPIGRQWWEREGSREPLVLEHQTISLVNEKGDHLRSESTSRVRARKAGASMWAASVSSYFYWDEKLHPVTVEKVLLDGKPANFVHRDHTLLVDLGRPLGAGDAFEATVVIAADMAKRPNNDSYWQPVASWRPEMGLDGELATYDITLQTRDPFIPFASGETVERIDGEGFQVVRSRIDKPTFFPIVAAGRYQVFSEEKNGYTCNIATYVFGKERGARVLHGLFFSATEIFEQFFGVPYPFEEVDIVEMNSWGWGQAPAGVIFITQEAYNPIGDTVSRFYSQGVNARFVHEVAHAWWGHVIKMDSWEEQWLTESFADYSAALAMQAMQPGKRGEREFNRIVREWRSLASQVGAGGSIYLANYLDSRDPTDVDHGDRYRLLYNKGPLVLHALRQELGRRLGGAEKGDKYFQALLRTFTTNFTNQYGETRHLVGILNQMTGDDWQPWFEKYVYGTEMPEVEI